MRKREMLSIVCCELGVWNSKSEFSRSWSLSCNKTSAHQSPNYKNKTEFISTRFALRSLWSLTYLALPFFLSQDKSQKTSYAIQTQSTSHRRPRKSAKIYLRLCWCKCWSGGNKNTQILFSFSFFRQIVLLSWRFGFGSLWGKDFCFAYLRHCELTVRLRRFRKLVSEIYSIESDLKQFSCIYFND